MDITVGPLVNLWGFGPNKQPVKTPTQAQITGVVFAVARLRQLKGF
jgi:thiamine biosynthesis lipoprotein ApbE